MAWNMQIRASRSWDTNKPSEDQPASPTSSTTSTPSEYEELHEYLKEHVRMVMECLSVLTINEPSSPTSSNMPLDRVSIDNIDHCQQNLTWDHLPDDIWTDDIMEWLDETSQQASEVHPAPESCRYPSWPPPALKLFTDIQWQRPVEEYSPSIYSQHSSAISPGHLPDDARDPMQEMPPSPMQDIEMIDILDNEVVDTHDIEMVDILDIAANIADVCIEIRATVNRAEDSAEFDDSDSDVSMLDLVDPLPIPAITFYDIARDRGLTISNSYPFSSDSGSNHSSIDRRHNRSNAASPQSNVTGNSNSNVPAWCLPQTRHHDISPDILGRMAQLLHSSVHDFALPTDENDVKTRSKVDDQKEDRPCTQTMTIRSRYVQWTLRRDLVH